MHSTESALIKVVNDIASEIDSKRVVLLVLLDMSAAFDTVEHTILLQKLDYYGIRGGEFNLIKSFLTNRKQYVG